ncbi:MAG: putative ferredoxin [Labilithrix sp.]|nr:putative ferredoxin [Labilithrix sp.]
MKIAVDRDRCEANQACVRAAPDVFQVDESDHLHVLVAHVTPEVRQKVDRAVRACPKRALSVVDDEDDE